MKTEKNLQEKIADMEQRVPGIEAELERSNHGNDGRGWGQSGWVQDVVYAETLDFQVVAAKWEAHHWDMDNWGGTVEWIEWLSVHFRAKERTDLPLLDRYTKKITTRNGDAKLDVQQLWPYDFVSLTSLEGNQVKASWVNEKGEEYPEKDQLPYWSSQRPVYVLELKPKILIADDDPEMRTALTQILKSIPCNIEAVSNVPELFKKWNTELPALLITDNRMGKGEENTGMYAIQQLRKDNKETPILLMSSFMTQDEKEEALRQGANEVLDKLGIQRVVRDKVKQYTGV